MSDHLLNTKNITAALCAALLAFCVFAAQGCTKTNGDIMDGDGYIMKYVTIDAKKAKEMIDTEEVMIVDVRTRQEYAEKHIPDAINIPLESIVGSIPAQLEGKDVPILIYCRSGRRSKEAAERLFDAGCSNLYDFGGIESWPYETVSSDEAAAAAEPVLILDHHEKSEKDGIVLEVTDYSGGILTARITNESDEIFEYGAAYELNVRENDEWTAVNWKEPMNWIDIAYVLSPGESQEFTCDLSFFEKIDSGFYQLVKGGLSTEFSLVYTE